MCGRYPLALSNEELYDSLQARLPRLFDNGRPRWERPQDSHPTYNVAPRSRGAVIRRDPDNGENAMIETMQWGLIPHWTKHPPSGGLNTINARSEGLLDPSSGGMWHALKGYKRCIVPAQGYYEWLKKSNTKIPHFARLPLEKGDTVDRPPLLFFAGLYDIVKYVSPVASKFIPSPADTQAGEGHAREPYPTGNPIPLATYTILTTEPAPDLRWLHDRMPCILTNWEDVRRWLDLGEMKGWEEGKGGTGSLLTGKPGLDCYPVPAEVGKIGNNSPTFIQPVSERADGIKSFFQKQSGSPAKAKKEQVKSEQGHTTKPKHEVKEETQAKAEQRTEKGRKGIKREAEGLELKVGEEEEKGLGDDSNAPNPGQSKQEDQNGTPRLKHETRDEDEVEIEEIGPPEREGSKRKRATKEINEEGDEKELKTKKRKGGHQTIVVRRTVDEGNKAQPAITSFFQSPSKPTLKTATRSSTRSKK